MNASRTNPIEPRREGATIGPSISIKGDLTGEEDLVIQGRVEGKVDLKLNCVTIGKNGRAKADICGKVIFVEGEVEGNLYGQEQIILRNSGQVRGNISAPRVSIEDGARFKGSIDMETKIAEKPRATAPAGPRPTALASPSSDHVPKTGITIMTETFGTKV